jgi:hypothetical protein
MLHWVRVCIFQWLRRRTNYRRLVRIYQYMLFRRYSVDCVFVMCEVVHGLCQHPKVIFGRSKTHRYRFLSVGIRIAKTLSDTHKID